MGRKRSNGEGAIYYSEAHQRWEAAIVVRWKTVTQPDGTKARKPVRKTITGKTRKIVDGKLDAARKALDGGLDVPDDRTTIEAFATWWMSCVLPGEGLAPATEQWYRDVLRLWVIPAVGARTLTGRRALAPGHVEQMTSELMADGHSHRVADASRTALGKVLRAAETRGLVGRNVARLAKPPKDAGKARKVKAFTVDEVAQILAALVDTRPPRRPPRLHARWRAPTVVGVTTGLRPGELFALHWPDIHLDGAEPFVSVRLSLSFPGGEPSLKAVKRERSYRTVPLAPEAVAELKAWRKIQAAEQLAAGELWSTEWPGLAFTNPEGVPVRVDTYRHVLGRVMGGAHPHRLRHTYATHLLEAGTPIHHVAELLGDSVATVEATYSHVLRTKHEVVGLASGLVAAAKA